MSSLLTEEVEKQNILNKKCSVGGLPWTSLLLETTVLCNNMSGMCVYFISFFAVFFCKDTLTLSLCLSAFELRKAMSVGHSGHVSLQRLPLCCHENPVTIMEFIRPETVMKSDGVFKNNEMSVNICSLTESLTCWFNLAITVWCLIRRCQAEARFISPGYTIQGRMHLADQRCRVWMYTMHLNADDWTHVAGESSRAGLACERWE